MAPLKAELNSLRLRGAYYVAHNLYYTVYNKKCLRKKYDYLSKKHFVLLDNYLGG